jgi:hypothetical protein
MMLAATQMADMQVVRSVVAGRDAPLILEAAEQHLDLVPRR